MWHSRLIVLPQTGARGDEAAHRAPSNLIRALDDGDHYALVERPLGRVWTRSPGPIREERAPTLTRDPERLLFDHHRRS